jgi:hypothetical protein
MQLQLGIGGSEPVEPRLDVGRKAGVGGIGLLPFERRRDAWTRTHERGSHPSQHCASIGRGHRATLLPSIVTQHRRIATVLDVAT